MKLVGLRSRDGETFYFPRDIIVNGSPVLAEMLRTNEAQTVVIETVYSAKVLDVATWILLHKVLYATQTLDVSYIKHISKYLSIHEIHEAQAFSHDYSL